MEIDSLTLKVRMEMDENVDEFIFKAIYSFCAEVTSVTISKAEIKSALKKQIAVPKHKYKGYRCICGEEVAKNQRYCEYCGQKLLDWSERDE